MRGNLLPITTIYSLKAELQGGLETRLRALEVWKRGQTS